MYVVVKVVVEVVPPLELVWMRYLIAVIALWIIGIMMRQSWKIAKRLADPISCWPYWEHDFHCDTGNGHNAVHRTDGAIITATTPAFMVVFARLILKESITLKSACLSLLPRLAWGSL